MREVMIAIQVRDMKISHTNGWLMCMCRPDMGNVIVAFVGCNTLLQKAIRGHFVLLTVRAAVTYQSLHVNM